jgi:copper chaperone CopZ
VVWIDILPSDDEAAVTRAATLFDDPRVTQFHDPARRAGAALARGLLDEPPAWDVYLCYGPDALWSDPPPAPADWLHQLGRERSAADRFRSGHDLAVGLHELACRHGLRPARSDPPTAEDFAAALAAAATRLADPLATGAARCERCAASGRMPTCSLAGWRHLVARFDDDDPRRLVVGPGVVGATEPAGRNLHFDVTGLRCSECMLRLTGAVVGLPGVLMVEVDLDASRLRLRLAHDAVTAAGGVVDAARAAGFELVRRADT